SGSSCVTVSVTGGNRVTAQSTYPNGHSFSWRDIFPTLGLSASPTDVQYIVLRDPSGVNVRRVEQVVSNTIIQIDEPTSFVNNIAQFMITPCGIVDSFNKGAPFGIFKSIVCLANSTANSTIRFVNNSILPLGTTITANGTTYSNSDV